MKLAAMMMVGPGEQDRYLPLVLAALDRFCDVIVTEDGHDFFDHEGRARQRLLEKTMAADPSHILAIDADEFVTDGPALRKACESPCPVLTLNLLYQKARRPRMPGLFCWPGAVLSGCRIAVVSAGFGSRRTLVRIQPSRLSPRWGTMQEGQANSGDGIPLETGRGRKALEGSTPSPSA